MNWTWQFEKTDGSVVTPGEALAAEAAFHSQADAETWVGENWEDLLEESVDAVTLLNEGSKVYGPMSLHPAGEG